MAVCGVAVHPDRSSPGDLNDPDALRPEHGVLTALSGGRALAQLILGEKPCVGLRPFSALRFGRAARGG